MRWVWYLNRFLVFLVVLRSISGLAQDAAVTIPAANPARPTVTIPAALPPTGYLQLEQGFAQDNGSPAGTATQFSVLQVTKIAVASRLMVQFLSQPYTRSRIAQPAGVTTDPGDLQVGVQAVLHKGAALIPTVSAGYIRRVRAGSSANLDAGGYSQSGLVLIGGDLPHAFHYDSNLLFNEQNNGSVRRGQFGQTLAVSHPVLAKATKGRLGGTVELSHFTQPFTSDTYTGAPATRANTIDLLFVGTYTPRPNIVLDASFDRGLSGTSTQWQGGFGVTYLLPRRVWGGGTR
jgi:hypothetical protein